MPELRDLLERRAAHHEPPADLFDRVLHRRRRRDRNRRVRTAVVGLAITAAAIGGLARAFLGDPETRPAEPSLSPFLGEWSAIDYHENGGDTGSEQTMTIRAGEDGVVHLRAQADQTSSVCWERRPGQNPRYVYFGSTMTGTGRLENATTLVLPSPVVACDGGDHRTEGPTRFEEDASYRLVLDPATDRVYDNLGVVWNRGAPSAHWVGSSTEEGVDGPGSFSMLHREVTFHASDPWGDHVEAYIDPRTFFLVTEGGDGADMTILVNPLPPDPCDTLRLPPSAQELVQAIRSNPDLEATTPVTDRVGGIDALRMDLLAAPGASLGPCSASGIDVVSVPGRPWASIEPRDLGRLYVLDLPGGSARTLAIWITAPDADLFEEAVAAAEPVLESFEFHTA